MDGSSPFRRNYNMYKRRWMIWRAVQALGQPILKKPKRVCTDDRWYGKFGYEKQVVNDWSWAQLTISKKRQDRMDVLPSSVVASWSARPERTVVRWYLESSPVPIGVAPRSACQMGQTAGRQYHASSSLPIGVTSRSACPMEMTARRHTVFHIC